MTAIQTVGLITIDVHKEKVYCLEPSFVANFPCVISVDHAIFGDPIPGHSINVRSGKKFRMFISIFTDASSKLLPGGDKFAGIETKKVVAELIRVPGRSYVTASQPMMFFSLPRRSLGSIVNLAHRSCRGVHTWPTEEIP
jgi:hypothetical protein